jgi:phosphoribosylformylglycinamidine cyclo-ligase
MPSSFQEKDRRAKMDYRKEIIDPGDEVSKIGARIRRESRDNSAAIEVVDSTGQRFRGLIGYRWADHVLAEMASGRICATIQCDGAGGKPQFHSLLNDEKAFRGLGWEIIAMNNDDIACGGGLPVLMANNLDVKNINEHNLHLVRAMLEGFGDALRKSNTVLMTGETAVMKHSITAFCDTGQSDQLLLTWGGTVVGLMRTDLPPIDGSTIKPGMPIIGLAEDGYRCNGGTALTEILQKVYGNNPAEIRSKAKWLLHLLVEPSRSYATAISEANGWSCDGRLSDPSVQLHAIAHITGGGVWGKFGELLPEGVGAQLDNMPEPPHVLHRAQILSFNHHPITDYHCYDTFHGGCGLLVVCEPMDCDRFIEIAEKHGHKASVVGVTTASEKNEVTIVSRFSDEGKVLSSLRPG